ncbi:hypothetical protein JVU11DRAFT_4668 [Chiua virens]|nr:hypothetical protein JVU11DRAFT_4668 [Chiua virens]
MFMSTIKSTLSAHDSPTTVHLNEVAKEVRAHEHARHRTKERREHALAKERKEKAAAGRGLGHGGLGRREAPCGGCARYPVQGADAANEDVASPRASTGSCTELTLGDIISRPRQPKAKQLDFEVIPHIRAVIALDDADADESWEYITRASVNDGSAWKGKSYAQAVASAM